MTSRSTDDAMQRFYQRVWRENVVPLLRGHQAEQRRKTARVGGKLAAASGRFLDSLLGLRGKPFTRSLTIMGTRLGALLPDAWDWRWWRDEADTETRRQIAELIERRALEMQDAEARALLDVPPQASLDELKQAWRRLSQHYHPDKAADDHQRREYHLRFITYQAAYERLCRALVAEDTPERDTDG